MRHRLLILLLGLLSACDASTDPPGPDSGVITDIGALAAGPDRLVAVGTRFHFEADARVPGSDSIAFYHSADGMKWVAGEVEHPGMLLEVAHGADRWVAVGRTGPTSQSGLVMASADGLSWSPVETGLAVRWSSVAYGNGQFAAAGYDAALGHEVIALSEDGATWEVTAGANLLGIRVTFGSGRFAVFGEAGWVGVSPDAEEWETAILHPMNRVTALEYADGAWTAFGFHDCCFGELPDSIHYFRATSADGLQWTVAETDQRFVIFDVAFGDSRWVAIGSGGIRVGPAPGEWSLTLPEDAETRPQAVARFAGVFAAVGRDGTWWSADGGSWTRAPLPPGSTD